MPTKKEKDAKYRAWAATLKRKYGITAKEYEALFKRQGGVCAICGRPPKTRRLHVDHCHRTKVVRGLLCFRCNRLFVGQHTLETARKIVAYLEKAA